MLPRQLREKLNKDLNPFEKFSDLFSGRDDRQDMTNMLLYQLLTFFVGQEPVQGESFPASMSVSVPLEVTQIDVMRNLQAVTTAIIPPQNMADCRFTVRQALIVNNGFDQQVAVTVIGNDANQHDGAFEIATFNVSAGARGVYGIKTEEWLPYLGCRVTPAVNPSSGTSISAAVLVQRQKTM